MSVEIGVLNIHNSSCRQCSTPLITQLLSKYIKVLKPSRSRSFWNYKDNKDEVNHIASSCHSSACRIRLVYIL